MMYSRETVVILEWTKLPSKIKEILKYHPSFHNDTIIEYKSEFSPFDEKTWQDTLTEKEFHDYHKDQTETNNYKKSFKDFIKDYGLEIDWWLKDQSFDLTGVKRILFEICW